MADGDGETETDADFWSDFEREPANPLPLLQECSTDSSWNS